MSGLTASLIVSAALGPCRAPVPAARAPDPMAKPVIGVKSQDLDSLFVGEVYPELPAGKAGVRPGDLLVRLGTFRPAGFQQLVDHIKAYRPGAVVELEVDRGGERKVFKLKLAPAPPGYGVPTQNTELLPILPRP